jgi:hypothetical protein
MCSGPVTPGACDTVLCGIAQPQRAVLLDGELDTVGVQLDLGVSTPLLLPRTRPRHRSLANSLPLSECVSAPSKSSHIRMWTVQIHLDACVGPQGMLCMQCPVIDL